MTRNASDGFTLIEIMIVVAIVAILATLTIPVYQQYVARAQVADGISLLQRARAIIEEYIVETAQFPTDVADLGNLNLVVSSRYVTSLSVLPATTSGMGVVYITFRTDRPAAPIKGQSVSYRRNADGLWTCLRAGQGATSLSDALLPKACS